MTTSAQFRTLPNSRPMRFRSHLLHAMGSRHDSPTAAILAAALCHTQIMVPASIAGACISREQALATLDNERHFGSAKRQGEVGGAHADQARPAQSGDPYVGAKILACREAGVGRDDVGTSLSEAATMNGNVRQTTEATTTPSDHIHGGITALKRLVCVAFALLYGVSVAATELGADMTNATAYPGAVLTRWNALGTAIGYAFAGQVERDADSGAKPWSVLTVGAQINAVNHSGIHQIVFGIATEAWADVGSFSMLTGIEATTINREANNPWRKISMWSTFKNRPDGEYFSPPVDPANMNTQALRIESQPGTGFERGIVFSRISLHDSRLMSRPVAIDFAEMDESAIEGADVMRFPDGCSVVYLGLGKLVTRCDK